MSIVNCRLTSPILGRIENTKIENWKILNEDFHERNLEQWFVIQTKLFPIGFPKQVIWEEIKDIINVF